MFECETEIDAICNSVHKVVACYAPGRRTEVTVIGCGFGVSQDKCVWKTAREWLLVDIRIQKRNAAGVRQVCVLCVSCRFAWFQVRRKRLMFTENGKKCDKYLVYPKAIYNHFIIHKKKEAGVYLQLLMLLLIRKV